MRMPSVIRRRVKELIMNVVGVRTADKIRNLINLKSLIFFDRQRRRRMLQLIKDHNSRSEAIDGSLDFFKALHKEFPTYDLSANYTDASLLSIATSRLNYLRRWGITLKNKTIYDFGAGNGETLFAADKFSASSAVGLDFSDEKFKQRLKTMPRPKSTDIDFKALDLVNDDIGSNEADVVVSFSAFEHFDDPSVVMEKCHNLLKPGGHLFVEFAAFNAPFATHRKIFSGVPHSQTIFKDEVCYAFFYEHLKINEGVNRYTNAKIEDGNPFPEVNRWHIPDYEKALLNPEYWDVVYFNKVYNYQYHWFIGLFPEAFKDKSRDFKYVDHLTFLLRKRV